LSSINGYPQAIDQTTAINELNLGESLGVLSSSLYLITGKETVYQQNPWLAQSFLRNLDRGLREGIYEGNTLQILNGRKASDMRVHFFKERLFKIRWTFDRKDFRNLPEVFAEFKEYFQKRYGPTTDTIFDDTFIWEGNTNRLQLFMDEKSIQVEFRDQVTEKTIQKL
jgi:hypothetical protein